MRTGFVILLLALIGLALGVFAASLRWQAATSELLARMRSTPHGPGAERFAVSELADLPAPVARYLRKVIPDGHARVRSARLEQRGTILLGSGAEGWRPFRATHTATVDPAAFVWDARVRVVPGCDALVRDGFVGGVGHMHASLLGIVTLADAQGTPELAAGALMRWLAEAAWYPTALLPGRGVTWSAVDDSTARATIVAGGTVVSLDFHFGADSLVTRVHSSARARMVNGRSIPTPWQGRFERYERCAGLLVPVAAEVEWLLPAGPQPYWRGRLVEVSFEYE